MKCVTSALIMAFTLIGGCRASMTASKAESTKHSEVETKVTAVTGTFSGDAAQKVHAALDIKIKKSTDPKAIKTEDGSLECKLISKKAACHYVVIEGKIAQRKRITLNPLTSKEIYNSLDLDTVERRGASIKEIGNLKCSLKIARELTYKCSLTNVNQVTIRSINKHQQAL